MSALATSILVFNERVKATASLLNTLAAAMIVFGVIRPLLDNGATTSVWALSMVYGLVGGAILNMLAWRVLGRLKDGDP